MFSNKIVDSLISTEIFYDKLVDNISTCVDPPPHGIRGRFDLFSSCMEEKSKAWKTVLVMIRWRAKGGLVERPKVELLRPMYIWHCQVVAQITQKGWIGVY